MKKHNEAGENPPKPAPCVLIVQTSVPESLNQHGAMVLAKRPESYWHARGYSTARIWAEPITVCFIKLGTCDLYRVACNLVNGLQPRYRDDAGSLPRCANSA